MEEDFRPLFVCGPTAAGKSSLAVALAETLDGEIVNADACQLYRGIERLSAAPGPAERKGIPHHLFGVLDPRQSNNAHAFLELARPAIEGIRARRRVPVVTGGSGLYLKFLSHGPPSAPPADPALREELDALPLEELQRRYARCDPAGAARADLANRRHLSRALEISLLSGRPGSELREEWLARQARVDAGLRGVAIRRQRPDLHARIAARCREMLEQGAVEEVAALPPETAATCLAAIGVGEIRDLLAGTTDRATCLERMAAATRQYAKRQESWFRRERWLVPVAWRAGEEAEEVARRALALLGIGR